MQKQISTESPGGSGLQSGQCRWDLTTRDGVRQEPPGGQSAGAGGKGPVELLRAEPVRELGPTLFIHRD